MSKAITASEISFSSLVQQYFTEYLVMQRALSPCTIASYRDAMMLFLNFTHKHHGKSPTELNLDDITPDLIISFLNYLEQDRHNQVRSRNLRLAALRAFLKFASHRDISSLQVIEQALGVPMKRCEQPMLDFLSHEEMRAVIGQPGETWTSQRDHLLLTMLYNTGARVSEIIAVKVGDVVINHSACVHLHGKGRKQRTTPLWKSTAQVIKNWLHCNTTLNLDSALLPNKYGHAMTRFNVTKRLNIAVKKATEKYRGLSKRNISPHTIRHTTAMSLLQSGVAFSVIALWLGHESTTTTHRYVEANLAMKEKALGRLQEPSVDMRRYHPKDDELMKFLQAL